MSRSKDIGTRAETAVARFLAANGFPHAERRSLRGVADAGDITGTPGVCWEVKGGKQAWQASDKDITDWLAETETERINAGADVGVLVIQRRGVGPANAGRWWAVMRLDEVADLATADLARLLGERQKPVIVDNTAPVRMLLADALYLQRTAQGTLTEDGELELAKETTRLAAGTLHAIETARLRAALDHWTREARRVVNSSGKLRDGEIRHELDRIAEGLEAALHPARLTDQDQE